MNIITSGTILPWVLGTLASLIILTTTITLRKWRDSKSSPYYFLRRQAEQQMQSAIVSTLGLGVIAFAVLVYGWQAPVDTIDRVARLTNMKPVDLTADFRAEEELIEIVKPLLPLTVVESDELLISSDEQEDQTTIVSVAPVSYAPVLPSEYYKEAAIVSLSEDTSFETLSFAKAMTSEYEPVSPRRVFGEGFFTLYATFGYEFMNNGMEWSWVWRHNGQLLGGGNELWQYGNDGNGYIYLEPEEGFDPGEYTLEIWVNGQLLRQANLIVSSQAAR